MFARKFHNSGRTSSNSLVSLSSLSCCAPAPDAGGAVGEAITFAERECKSPLADGGEIDDPRALDERLRTLPLAAFRAGVGFEQHDVGAFQNRKSRAIFLRTCSMATGKS